MAVHCFLVCHILPLLTLVAVEALQYGRRGFHTTLAPEIRGTPDRILWKQASRRVVEFDGSEESVHGSFRDRVVLDWHAASLTIKDLQETDSGPYELEATINNKKYYSQHEVEVIDKVAVPTISCVIGGGGDANPPRTPATLKCSAEGPPSLIVYHWSVRYGGRVQGAELPVDLAGDQDVTVYTCKATNPVSQETGTFVAKECYPDSSSPAGWTIAIVVICLLLVLSAGIFWGYRRWKKAHPKINGIEDVEEQPLHRSNGSDNTKAYEKENEATLPSSQRLALLFHRDPATDSTSGPEEDQTACSGGWGDSTRVSVHSSEFKLPESQQPTNLKSKLTAGDSLSILEEPSLESEIILPPTASPAACGLHPVATELDATQTRSHQDSEASSFEDLQSSSLKTTDPTTRASPSPALPETAPGNQPDSDVTTPQPLTPRDGHLGSDEGGHLGSDESGHLGSDEGGHLGSDESSHLSSDEGGHLGSDESGNLGSDESSHLGSDEGGHLGSDERGHLGSDESSHLGSDEGGQSAHADLFGSDPAVQEPAAVALREREEDAAALAPLSSLCSSSEEEEEKEERKDTGVACVSTGDEPSGERLVAADDPPGNVEALPSETKEEVNDAEAPQGEADLREEGEVEEDDGEEGGLVGATEQASQTETHCDSDAVAGERGTDRSEEDAEETSHTSVDEHENAEEGGREEDEDSDVTETSHDDPQGPEEGDGEDRGAASLPASRPETHRDSEAVAGDGIADTSKDETLDVETPERKEEEDEGPQTVHDDADVQEDGEEEEEGGKRGRDDRLDRGGVGS